MHGLTYKADRL